MIAFISFVFYFVGIPTIGATLYLGISGVLSTIALKYAVEVGGLARSVHKHPENLVGKKGELIKRQRSCIKILSTQHKDEKNTMNSLYFVKVST